MVVGEGLLHASDPEGTCSRSGHVSAAISNAISSPSILQSLDRPHNASSESFSRISLSAPSSRLRCSLPTQRTSRPPGTEGPLKKCSLRQHEYRHLRTAWFTSSEKFSTTRQKKSAGMASLSGRIRSLSTHSGRVWILWQACDVHIITAARFIFSIYKSTPC